MTWSHDQLFCIVKLSLDAFSAVQYAITQLQKIFGGVLSSEQLVYVSKVYRLASYTSSPTETA